MATANVPALLLLLLFTSFLQFDKYAEAVTYTVSGRVFCPCIENPAGADQGPPPQSRVQVQLWEEDRFDSDDKWDETCTAADGSFRVQGDEKEIGEEEPILMILHACPPKKGDTSLKQGCLYHSRLDLHQFYDADTDAHEVTIEGLKVWLGEDSVTIESNSGSAVSGWSVNGVDVTGKSPSGKMATEVKCG